jgi:hypothetical protein
MSLFSSTDRATTFLSRGLPYKSMTPSRLTRGQEDRMTPLFVGVDAITRVDKVGTRTCSPPTSIRPGVACARDVETV